MNDSAASIEGARIGINAMLRHNPFHGMQLRWIANANMNAIGTVSSVVSAAKASVFEAEFANADVDRYCAKPARPTNAPLLSSTLRISIVASGTVRNASSATA